MNMKQRLLRGEPAFGTMITAFDTPEMVRILKDCGIEWFFFDTESRYPNPDRMYSIFGYAKMLGVTGFIRIPEVNKTEVFRAMDLGVDGIVCPCVETPEQAKELVRLAKYAPMGQRGVSVSGPHTEYKTRDFKQFMTEANENTILIAQMESVAGIERIDEILSVEGIDGVLIGCNDLSQDMGIYGQLNHPDFLTMTDRVIEACKRHGKFAGIIAKDVKTLRGWQEKGVSLLQWGSDVAIFASKVREGMADAR